MEEFNILLNSTESEILDSLDKFQADILQQFLTDTSNNYTESADKWLTATTANTFQFGGEQGKTKIYIEKVLDEIEKFICGNEDYAEERKEIGESTDKTKEYLIGVMSTAIGQTMGVAGAFIAPVIALLIMSIGKIAVNAWCAMRQEMKAT
ncbi:hypothetical protein [Polaribacter sp. Hel1_85]|uniref:hypothetical protein n=1 Tax=Polaribacter sp. Hel1_85 TaxID=1250005 RepID=UPI00052D8F9E|nr:hypothetical protein [Polaribacter sp. Hel1_85]KGL58406.1 hypothetical protein PHEL85_3465 [Polaribacter sp. Hel1_85]